MAIIVVILVFWFSEPSKVSILSCRLNIVILLSLILLLPATGQERWQISRLSEGINFDGKPDETVWKQAEPFPIVSHSPVSGNPPGEHTVVRVAYDEQYVYVGAMLYVSNPDLIQAYGKKRDFSSPSCDWFGISFDTYNDKENALLFFTNPNGLRWDATVSNDGTPVRTNIPLNMSWNTYWDVKTVTDDQGWYLEMRIPISSLRFQVNDITTIMGLSIFRWLPAKNEVYIFPETPLEWGEMSKFKPSLYAEVEFRGLEPKKPLYITPYLLTGFEQNHELNTDETAYEYNKDFILEPGLDIKYGFNPNTTLDLTVNTDFAQVEADDQQFNLTRFSLVFPEKRPFFLERSSIFDFGLGGPNTLFYSRRIGLYEEEPVRIWGGARLNSRVKEWDIGLMDLQTASLDDLPSENFGVFRLKKRIINNYSYTGGMVTSRIGVDGSYNVAYGLDGVIRLFGNDYLTVRWAQTFSDTTRNNPLSLDPTRFMVSWEKRKQDGFAYSLMITRSGTEFEPGVGLEIFQDYYASSAYLDYTWISPEEAALQNHNISLLSYHLNDVSSGDLLTFYASPGWTFNSKNGWMGSFNLNYEFENLQEEFEILDPVIIPVGNYRFMYGSLILYTPASRPYSVLIKFEGGQYYDGLKFSPSIKPKWNLGPSVELEGIYRFDYASFPDRNQTLNNHIIGIRTLYMLSTRISFSGFVQYNTAIHKVISNFRFRYNPKEGTDLYIVFNEGRNTYLEREVPNLPVYDQRNITLKFTYTFEL
jgi:hypothetical protein